MSRMALLLATMLCAACSRPDNAAGAGSITVNIDAADVATTSTTFNNTITRDYFLNSTGSFGISEGSLTKNGTGNVTISTVNTYTATTTVNNGTLTLSGNRTAPATGGFNVGTVPGNTGTLNVTNGSFTVGSTGSTFNVGSVAGSTGILNQSGTSSLTTSGNQLLIGNDTSTGTYHDRRFAWSDHRHQHRLYRHLQPQRHGRSHDARHFHPTDHTVG